MIDEFQKSYPSVAPLLASPVEPVKQAFQSVPPEVHNTWIVAFNSVVVVITDKYLIQLCNNVRRPLKPYESDCPVDFLAFLHEFLPAGLPSHFELAVARACAIMRESKKCKCFRLTFSAFASVFLCKSSKFNKPALAFREPGSDKFDTLAEANEHLLNKCIEKNRGKLKDGRIPAETFEKEKPFLMAEVPPMPCFIKRSRCSVDKYSTVSVNCVRYIYVGKKVDVRIYTDRVVAYSDASVIAEHPRCFRRGSYHLDIFHYLRTLKRKPGALPQSTAMLQSDTLIKNIYEQYYSNDPRTFLQVLEVIHERGAQTVAEGLSSLVRISPLDLSADKVKVVCDKLGEKNNSITKRECSSLSRKIRTSLSQYDRLREVMNPEQEAAV